MSAFRVLVTGLVMLIAAMPGLADAAVSSKAAGTTRPLELARIFSDHMVLQRERPIRIWGWATTGTRVHVSLQEEQSSGTRNSQAVGEGVANNDGHWTAIIPRQEAGGPYKLQVESREHKIVLNDVLIGEVWVCSGQSNMDMVLKDAADGTSEAMKADFPQLRLFSVPWLQSPAPLDNLGDNKGWQHCSPETATGFSAVSYYFGRDLHLRLNVPVGLIKTALGASPAEAWMSAEALTAFPEFEEEVSAVHAEAQYPQHAWDLYRIRLQTWDQEAYNADPGTSRPEDARPFPNPQSADDGWKWASPELDTSGWKTFEVPGRWESQGLPYFDGSVWLRKDITLPDEWTGRNLELDLGRVDDDEITWFNGERIGETTGAMHVRKYQIPGNLVKKGSNNLTVRVFDNGGGGGLTSPGEEIAITLAESDAGSSISLAGAWKMHAGVNLATLPYRPLAPGYGLRPTVLFNAMVKPLIPYTTRGVIWYQGESNAERAAQYRTLFPALIKDWRRQWNNQELAFLYVQLAGFLEKKKEPGDDTWAELREAQSMALELPLTGMASAVDLGETYDIHPKRKRPVGERLARAARAVVYGQDVEWSGPTYKAMKRDGRQVKLTFTHIAKGLVVHGEKLRGFAIAGEDRKFVWADARVEGDEVVVSAQAVNEPVAVRYSWESHPDGNLYNSEGLPAVPFRTDDWKGISRAK